MATITEMQEAITVGTATSTANPAYALIENANKKPLY